MTGADSRCENLLFTRALATLKRHGSNLLVVGECGHGLHDGACSRFLGSASDEPRRRLFVHTDEIDPQQRIVDERVATERIRQIEVPTATRCAAGAESQRDVASTGSPTDPSRVESGAKGRNESPELPALVRDILHEIDDFERSNGGFDAGELRVCLDSLLPLLSNHHEETVFRFLHLLTWRIREADGMGHVHLPVPRSNEHVRLLSPLFEAVIEIEHAENETEHRWHLRDHDFTSDWLAL